MCRVSTPEQDANGNLDEQMMTAWRQLRAAGHRHIAVYDGVETSRVHGNRIIFERAIDDARQHGAILVAASRDRFIRAASFGRGQKAKCEPPSDHEYRELVRLADGVPLATIIHPDDPGVRAEQIKRGQRAKGRRGGRPPKKPPGYKRQRRIELRPRAIELRRQGWALRRIGAALNVNESTLRGWRLPPARFFAERGDGERQSGRKNKGIVQ
jgi:DNA invertase Pin-like site-specific DNA recombinase